MNTCKDCKFWSRTSNDGWEMKVSRTTNENEKVKMGICRRYAPHPTFANSTEEDWCGEFVHKPNPAECELITDS